jgi:hypothetical protein
VRQPNPKLSVTLCLIALAAAGARAQSSCSSDGQPRPAALLERFINADCEPCWRAAGTTRPARGELALDWVTPGSRGDDAPLSAVALREAGARLESLRLTPPPLRRDVGHRVRPGTGELRVAHGQPFNGYIGTSIELERGRGGPLQAWLLLVEQLPAGTEGSPVERNLVRSVLQLNWDAATPRSESHPDSYFETRPMAIPRGADASRLRVVGWIQDDRGRLRAVAASGCTPRPGKG